MLIALGALGGGSVTLGSDILDTDTGEVQRVFTSDGVRNALSVGFVINAIDFSFVCRARDFSFSYISNKIYWRGWVYELEGMKFDSIVSVDGAELVCVINGCVVGLSDGKLTRTTLALNRYEFDIDSFIRDEVMNGGL